jgi:hypothetical protein
VQRAEGRGRVQELQADTGGGAPGVFAVVTTSSTLSSTPGLAEAVPGILGGGAELAPVEQNDVLVAAQVEGEAVVVEVGGAAQVFEAAGGVAVGEDDDRPVGRAEAVGEAALAQSSPLPLSMKPPRCEWCRGCCRSLLL